MGGPRLIFHSTFKPIFYRIHKSYQIIDQPCLLCYLVISVQACDDFSHARGFNHTYDAGNLYHSLEFAQNDHLQLGQYSDANILLMRQDAAVVLDLTINSKTEEEAWKNAQKRMWEQRRNLRPCFTLLWQVEASGYFV